MRTRGSLIRSSLFVLVLGIAALWGCSQEAGNSLSPTTAPSTPTALSARSTADLAAAMKIQDSHTPDLMRIPGVVGTGTGASADGRAVLLVLTRAEGVRGVPSSLDGVPVQVRVVGDVVAYKGKPDNPGKPGSGGPLQCGTSAGNDNECTAGTIGCVVMRGASAYFLSNNHVFARENAASNGERIDAPGRYDAHPKCAQTPQIATLSESQPLDFNGGDNTIDAAIAAPIAGLDYTCAEAGGYTPSSTVVAPSVGLAVKKTGRSSRLTHGTIEAIHVTVAVGYAAGTAIFTDQILTPGRFLRSGDSGSLMVTETGNDPVGLLFAGGPGGSFANPIQAVLDHFNVTVCGP
jgi:hypothetical protein